jgi:hypothetical protein
VTELADAGRMKKDQLLWWLGSIALAFTYLAAVNVKEAGSAVIGATYNTPAHTTYFITCEGMWNPTEWFKSGCGSSLPSRFGVLALGVAILIVCGYFADKTVSGASSPVKLHTLAKFPSGTYKCQDCGFETTDLEQVRFHNLNGSRVTTAGSTLGFGPASSPATVPAASPTAQPVPETGPMPTASSEHKACPDCAEQVLAAARKCRFCGYMFDSQPATQG